MTISDITILGDVHLGRKFVTGVPLHRRGDREQMVWDQFEDSLINCKTNTHIQTGDLFDTFAVPEALLLRVALTYRTAAAMNPGTQYIVYRGNHDASRDTDKASSFDVLAELLKDVPHIRVMRDVDMFFTSPQHVYGVIPWHPFKSSEELAQELIARYPTYTLSGVFGHFDVESFGGSTFNLVPTKTLSAITNTIYTGHIHLPTEFERDGVRVVVVGSMQPYAHGEDPTTDWYETITHDFLLESMQYNAQWVNTNLRVITKPGEVVPEIECLSLITKPFKEKAEEISDETLEVSFGDFNMRELFTQCLTTAKVGQTIADKITAKFEELKNV